MNELDEAGRALLALAGDAHDPTDADRTRVRAVLAARLGVAAGLGVGAAITTATAATAKAAVGASAAKAMAASATGLGTTGSMTGAVTGSALAAKLVVAVAITATVGVGATVTVKLARQVSHATSAASTLEVRGRRTAMTAPQAPGASPSTKGIGTEPPAEAPPIEPALPAAPAVAASNHEPSAPAGTTDATAEPIAKARPDHQPAITPATAAPDLAPPVARSAGATDRPKPAQIASPASSASHRAQAPASPIAQACGPTAAARDYQRPALTVADEARLVHDGVRALRDGQAACALSLLDTHARYYPAGVLAPERDVERALALADLGRMAEARAVAAAFLRAHPASPLGARLRQRIPGIDAVNQGLTGTTPRTQP